MSLDFSGRKVVITGASGALGQSVLAQLLESGANCFVPLRRKTDSELFRHANVEVATGIDLTEESSVERYYVGLPSLWGSVHAVGGFEARPFRDTRLADFEAQLRLNLVSSFLCSREALRRMDQNFGGRIVNVAAGPALDPRSGSGMVAYTCAKAAVAALTQSLSRELAPIGVWVNAVAPAIFDTEANRRALPEVDHSGWPKAADVARTIVFLASPDNRCTTGAVVPVPGRVP